MYGSIFIQICAVGSKGRIFSAPECVLAVQGRLGSSKVLLEEQSCQISSRSDLITTEPQSDFYEERRLNIQ